MTDRETEDTAADLLYSQLEALLRAQAPTLQDGTPIRFVIHPLEGDDRNVILSIEAAPGAKRRPEVLVTGIERDKWVNYRWSYPEGESQYVVAPEENQREIDDLLNILAGA